MRLHRTTTALAALLMVGSLGACAEYTTTGVPSDEEAAAEEVTMEEGNPLEATSWALTESSLSSQDLGTHGHHRRLLRRADVRSGPGEQLLRGLHGRGCSPSSSARSVRP